MGCGASAAAGGTGVERTLVLIKPDAVSNGYKDEILKRVAEEGFKVIESKPVVMDRDLAIKFFKEHEGKPWFEDLVDFMLSGASLAILLEREDAVRRWRKMMGHANPKKASVETPTSVRSQFGKDWFQNAVHGSDSISAASREIKMLFPNSVGS